MQRIALELRQVGRAFNGTRAVSDVSMEVNSGEFITLLGPSGCGKTTTLRMIAGFIDPTQGEIVLDGHLISASSGRSVPPEKRNIGMVFQSYAVWPHMTVRQNVELPLKLRRVDRREIGRRADEVLEICRLRNLADRSPHELSGGQLQRVALARALVYRPSVILLDEPLSNLDVALREELRRQLHDLHREMKATFILVTHDQVEAMSLSDRVVVMRDGRIQQIGKPEEIYRSPASDFVAQFVGAANILHAKVMKSDERGARVACGALKLWTTSGSLVSGEEVTLAVHPESITLSPIAGPYMETGEVDRTENRFEAVVRAAYFLGRTQEVLVEANGIQLKLVQSRDVAVREGQAVVLAIRAASVLVLPPSNETIPNSYSAAPEVKASVEGWSAFAPH